MKHLFSFATTGPLEACAEFRIGISSVPSLADHGFQDMVVLPGSFYVEVALGVDRKLCGSVPGVVRNITFHNPIILSAQDTIIKVQVRHHGDAGVEYTFYEDDGRGWRANWQYAARLEIERKPLASARANTEPSFIEAFQARANATIESDRFYRMLHQNGNQYGPSFQKVSSIWRAGDQSLGRLCVPRQTGEIGSSSLDASVLDSVTQLLAPFVIHNGKTFILRSIERFELIDTQFPETLWGHAVLREQGDGITKGFLGDIRVFDQSGKTYVELFNVAFTFLDSSETVDQRPSTKVVIAANFTAEPVEDSLRFWSDYFGVQTDLEFAPYNQVFQQLLDTESRFGRNSGGINIILLALEDWAAKNGHTHLALNEEKAHECFLGRTKCILPNGLEIVHLNQYETDYLYKEIFEDQCYLKHGVRLQDGATVLDIGANIGLFSLFVMSRCKDAKIYAFEPAPEAYELLKANCEAYGLNVHTSKMGISDRVKTAAFTFYEKSSVFSGFHSDESEDREAIQAIVRNLLKDGNARGESVEEYVTELTADRLRRKTCEAQLTSISDIIHQNQIQRIDLLKIDAEKSELDIIQGIDEGDWPKIEQLVIEIHDRTGRAIEQITALLNKKGYRCAIEHEQSLKDSGLFNLYATKPERQHGLCSNSTRDSLTRNVQGFCAALRSFMGHTTAPLLVCVCPRSPAAEADAELKRALNEAEQTLLSQITRIPGVHTIGSAALLQRYPLEHYYDQDSYRVGHIPYTPECYAAIGTALVRTICNFRAKPFKVIALDCDHTLWKGVCGEDGTTGIQITPPYRMLQQFMIDQVNRGMLLCLCSKNNEKDALDVFNQRSDMLLKREHLISWRLDWNSKSTNLKSLADDLNLGLDSFIFIDDNPVDCADVRINCPEVLTLQLPQDPESFASFLNHIWAFDPAGSTEEDRNRTRMYQEGRQRQNYRKQSFSLKDFVDGLQLRVEITEAGEDQLGRVSQLTLRTNQFNFTSVRRSETEIKDFLKRQTGHCLVIRAVDRFGDYGFVGVLMYEVKADRFDVDTLLLSCRVLGRGVEHAVVAWLGQQAVNQGKKSVQLTYRPTEKNRPALEFITSIGDQFRNENGTCWIFPAERLASIEFNPDERPTKQPELFATTNQEQPQARAAWVWNLADRSERLQHIGENLCDVQRLAKAIEEHRLRKETGPISADITPSSTLETALLNIWRKVLAKPRIGLNDNFFEAGGTSLRAVQVLARINKDLKQNLSIVTLFECPTVALLAAKLGEAPQKATAETQIMAAARRGHQRRYKTMRQHGI